MPPNVPLLTVRVVPTGGLPAGALRNGLPVQYVPDAHDAVDTRDGGAPQLAVAVDSSNAAAVIRMVIVFARTWAPGESIALSLGTQVAVRKGPFVYRRAYVRRGPCVVPA